MDTQRYQHRVVDDELDELTPSLPALALEGPKGVGKTATASRRAATIHRLDDPAQRSVALADPSRLVKGPPPVLIDEWQHVPESWDLVRRAVDDGAPPGQFFLTGSASPADLSTHSGAGRIVTVRMRPLALTERGIGSQTVSLRSLLSGGRSPVAGQTDLKLEAYVDEILASGFPGLRGLSGRALRAQLDSYLGRIVERDFEELGHPVRNPAALRRWMTAYAAASSTTASYETIRDAATSGQGEKPAKTATMPYRDVLERLWIVDAVPAWLPTRNRISRLSAPSKHQLADPALAARLLGVDAKALLDATPVGPPIPRDGTLLGALFESVVTLDLRVYAQAAEATVKHLRTHGGEHEIDLIVERADGRVVAVEVKLARALRQVLARAVVWGMIDRNPAKHGVDNPQRRYTEKRPFDSWAELAAVAAEIGPRHGPMVMFAAATGLRPGEWIALERRDVDREARVVYVRRAYRNGRLKCTKTEASVRAVPLQAIALAALEEVPADTNSALLFPSPHGWHLDLHNFRNRDWKPAQHAAGITPLRRVYDLRHTFATFALRAGISTFDLSRYMGASLTMIDRHYGHLARDGRDHAINLLDAFTGSDGVNVHAVDAAWTSEASTVVHADNGKTS